MHLFSGRRRWGDCHWWLEQLGPILWPGVQIKLLSLDTAVHTELGNLAKGANLQRLLRLARQGVFAGSLTGPPCETWSAARHLQLDGHRGPRPLRLASSPWCVGERSSREMRQCQMGTELMCNSWEVEGAIVLSGGGVIKEHPWENDNPAYASVWRTAVHEHWMMSLPNAHRHRIDQYLYGSKGTKPTCLRAIHLGDPAIVARALQDGAEPWRVRPQTQLKGRNAAGEFNTASAKEYPVALCRTILAALTLGLRRRAEVEGLREPTTVSATDATWLRDALSASEKFSVGSWLPDYQGS